jgi:hypothetical protein
MKKYVRTCRKPVSYGKCRRIQQDLNKPDVNIASISSSYERVIIKLLYVAYTHSREKHLKSLPMLLKAQFINAKSQRKLSAFVISLSPALVGYFDGE